GPIPWQR
uniref:Tryptophyllin-1 n=1 Tax=Ascaphus truei TaxID=8439 RepID=TY1_ASCTR|nr:RecName: Full=Tryptophyllin-1 [Ascaphus truei]